VYLNGSIVCDLGGVHGDSEGTCTSATLSLSPGDVNLEVFYADIENVAAALTFGVTTENITGAPPTGVPEPFTLSIFGAGLASAVALRRRKKAKA